MNVFLFLLPVIALLVIVPPMSVHMIDEGHIGIYWYGGALMKGYTEPGVHFKVPFITKVANVQITLQTDTVRDIPCGTSGGVMIYFDKIEVVNRLSKDKAWNTIKSYGVEYDKTWIFDKIHHEINQFCSSHTLMEVYISEFEKLDEALATALQADCNKWDTGISIQAIRVTKPRIPQSVEANFKMVEEQKARLMVAQQQQEVALKEEETKRRTAKIAAEKEAEVSIINAERESRVEILNAEKEASISIIQQNKLIKEMEAVAQRTLIENEMMATKMKMEAEALSYRITAEAEANKLLHTPQYLQLALFQSIANNTKIFFGDSIPQMFSEWMVEGKSPLVVSSTATSSKKSKSN